MSSKAHRSAEVQENKLLSHQKSRKFMNVTVYFLDESNHVFQLQAKNLGQVLFDKVCKHINLLEVDYFGLECEDEKGNKFWLDVLKPLSAQLPSSFPTMYFQVKFYTPDPVQLEDEFTRYLLGLQIKKDLFSGTLQCNDNTAAVLISYIVQGEMGDFNSEKYIDNSYLSTYKFVPYQDAELERKVMENHKKIIGQTSAEADLNLLETARRCELYGVKMTPAKDQEGVPLNLAVAHSGVLVFQNLTKINTFSWAKIRKLSFKRKKFLIKLHSEGYGYYKDTVEFFFEGRNECKNFWKKCIENHTFFRCSDAKQGMRQKPKIFSRGSSFRYSGRTQKQVSEFVREQCLKRSPFQRSTSLKTPVSPSRSLSSTMTTQPLLPLSSASCGSISDVSKEAAPLPKATSEPSTPLAASEFIKNANNGCSKTVASPVSPGSDQEGFQSSYYSTQDNDNVSHDSYFVIEKETTNISYLPTTDDENILEDKLNEPLSQSIKDEIVDEHKENVDDKCNLQGSNPLEVLKILENNNNNTVLNELTETILLEESRRQAGFKDILDESKLLSIPPTSDLCDSNNHINSILDNHSKLFSEQNSKEEPHFVTRDSEQNFETSTFYLSSPYAEKLSKKKKIFDDKAYCLAKELLMTERTYRKDLEIINVVFRDEFHSRKQVRSDAIERILTYFDSLYEMHCSLLREMEQSLAFWEGRPANKTQEASKGITDIFLQHKEITKVHSIYLENLPQLLESLHQDLNNCSQFTQMYRQFEGEKVCYLSFTSFLLRPAFRIPYYKWFLSNFLTEYNSKHIVYDNNIGVLEEFKTYCENFEQTIQPVINYSNLMEIQCCLIGCSSLVDKNREFVREGCLSKLTKTGCHQHMFFLFSDLLLCTVRVPDGQLHFGIKEKLHCKYLTLQETEPTLGFQHCFMLCDPESPLVLASPSSREHSKWTEDLENTFEKVKRNPELALDSPLFSFDETLEHNNEDIVQKKNEAPPSGNINRSVHICWHRNISISREDLLLAMKTNLSGYLLRKFKNSSGWQKVWVVLANLCLFFYRSYLDDSPLASLPLAGYKIMKTSNCDIIFGTCIFKLMFKSHEYFFMVENKYSFDRWVEAIHSCTLAEEENTHL